MSKDKRRTALECAGAEILSRLGWTLTDEDGAEVTASDVADIIEAASEGDACEWAACDIANPAAFVEAADAIRDDLERLKDLVSEVDNKIIDDLLDTYDATKEVTI